MAFWKLSTRGQYIVEIIGFEAHSLWAMVTLEGIRFFGRRVDPVLMQGIELQVNRGRTVLVE